MTYNCHPMGGFYLNFEHFHGATMSRSAADLSSDVVVKPPARTRDTRQMSELIVMRLRSAGLLVFRRTDGVLEILLVHPGGPFSAKKDEGAWSIPKGLVEPSEEDLAAAIRETEEELGVRLPVASCYLAHTVNPAER